MTASPDRLPFSEAIDYFRSKTRLPSSGWTDLWQEQHSHAFVVAGAAHDGLVEDFYNAIRQAQEKGTGYPAFRAQFDEIVAKYGWAHNGAPGWRSKIIYDTNIRQAYNAGRWKQMMDVAHLRPFLQYQHTSTEHPRLQHLAWDGLILPATDPWWNTHMPQNGWRCQCRVHSLSRVEAQRQWESQGKTGPDEAPPIEWEERVVGAQGSAPRTVRVPKGIDPGFAYNPGKAWLEPQTVPPLTGYDAVLKERGTPWPTSFTPPPTPRPTLVPKSVLLPSGTAPEVAVTDFLDVFGASMTKGAVFTDAAGSSLAITKALFEDGQGQFKWLSAPRKAARLESINLLAMTLIEPDEIWWGWVKDFGANGRWRLKRRYLRAFELGDSTEYGMAVFEWGSNGWTGATAFMGTQKTAEDRAAYFDKQRIGRLVFKK
ncbi:PBECR2 nuclease fold domain-containing protein [Pandoraea apista]|uniref:Mu-like prophage FluMu F protein n=1 Tax=Pandoraea apista TaxID=93218 RepID=A0A5E5P6Z3_9BURK|nr:PBECR2 nuclease fold domain-containing protein [Pandoraea apista]AJF00075.1 Mu-like prophage FluMu F protein [Pandoraea apista]AKH74229.1 Mu-like prophage FluMu F protein [Pandoraea apista]AKI62778.1 Mu-like prophage FluMu F protein [Pandoraea apista]VVG72130.1 Mu-like prophage FluMu F protein [Pandoraea apista]